MIRSVSGFQFYNFRQQIHLIIMNASVLFTTNYILTWYWLTSFGITNTSSIVVDKGPVSSWYYCELTLSEEQHLANSVYSMMLIIHSKQFLFILNGGRSNWSGE